MGQWPMVVLVARDDGVGCCRVDAGGLTVMPGGIALSLMMITNN